MGATLPVGEGCARNTYVRPTPAPAAVASPTPDAVTPGTLLSAQVHEPLSTSTNRPGDRFTLELLDPVIDAGGREVLGRGTTLAGVVKRTDESKVAGDAAGLQLQVLGVQAPGEGIVPVPLEVAESPVEMSSGVGREVLAGVAGGALGAGAGIAIDKDKTGLVVGTTLIGIGAGALLAYLLGTRDATIPGGSVMTLRVTRPMVLARPVAAFPECPVMPARAASREAAPAKPPDVAGVSTVATQPAP